MSPLLLGGCVSSEGGLLGVAEIGAGQPATETASAETVAADKAGTEAGKSRRVAAARNGTISGSHEIDEMIARAADANDVPRELAYAVVRVESRYNPQAVGPGGVYGLSQIKPATARSLGFSGSAKDLLDPETNLKYGMKYLAGAWRKGGQDVCATSMKYKGGHLATTMTQSARSYCSSVKQHMASLSNHPMGTSEMARLQPARAAAPATLVAARPAARAQAPVEVAARAPAATKPVEVAANSPARIPQKAPSAKVAVALAPVAKPAAPAALAMEAAMKVPVPGHATRPQGTVQAQIAEAAPRKVAVPTHSLATARTETAQSFAAIPVPRHADAGFDNSPDPARFGK